MKILFIGLFFDLNVFEVHVHANLLSYLLFFSRMIPIPTINNKLDKS